MYIYIYIYFFSYSFFIFSFISIYIYIYIYIFMYMYMYMHIYIYIHTCMHRYMYVKFCRAVFRCCVTVSCISRFRIYMFLFVSLLNSWYASGLYWAAITLCRGSSQSVVTVNDDANDV